MDNIDTFQADSSHLMDTSICQTDRSFYSLDAVSTSHTEFATPQFTKPRPPSGASITQSAPSKSCLRKVSFSEDNQRAGEEDHQTVGNDNDQKYIWEEQTALIEDQMRKHIQLLTQSFLLLANSSNSIDDETLKCQPQNYLAELKYLRNTSAAGEASVYNVCNLDPALDVVEAAKGAEFSDTNFGNASDNLVILYV